MAIPDNRQTLEKTLEKTLAIECASLTLRPQEYAKWLDYRYVSRVLVSKGKIFAVWRWNTKDRKPVIVTSLTVKAVSCCTKYGLEVTLETSKRETITVGHNPKRLADLEIFSHVPFLPDVTYTPQESGSQNYVLRLPLIFRMAGNPERPADGYMYATPVGEFRANYPEFADCRF